MEKHSNGIKRKWLVVLAAVVAIAVFACLCACGKKGGGDGFVPTPGTTVTEDGTARNFAFGEYVGTIGNPGVGYTRVDSYHTALGDTKVHDVQGDVILFLIDLSPFSGGANGTGVDHDLDAAFFAALDGTFENCRQNGSTIAMRFRYDENGKDNPEPNTFDQVLAHIAQIKASNVLQKYKDIIMFVESGFVGKWGEQHGGKYTTVQYKAQLLAAMLDCVPSPIPVTVRTPDTFAAYAGITRAELLTYVAPEGSDAARVGLYDDGYMGSDSDLGTYADRAAETSWLGRQTLNSYFGGEFSGNLDFAKKYDTYLPENCIPEMYKTHLSYINGNIFALYKDMTFNKALDVEGYDNSAYYGKSVFDFIRDHLGYRFVLKNSTLPVSVGRGGTVDISFKLVNNGFANPVKRQTTEVVFERDGVFVSVPVSLDPTKWRSGETVESTISIDLPGLMTAGRWNVYLKSSFGNDGFSMYHMRSVRFANNDVWNGSLGANFIGYTDITESSDAAALCDNTICEVGAAPSAAHLYSLGGGVKVDGAVGDGEWTAADKIAESDGHGLYVKCDENYLYVMSDIAHNSKSPVFNLRVKTAADNEQYWVYQQTSGFIYFNKDGERGHSGMLMKYTDDAFEFKIPFYMFSLTNGTVLSEVSVFVQDSGNDWKGMGTVKTTESYIVTSVFTVYNAKESLVVSAGTPYSITLYADADITGVVWKHDGAPTGDTGITLDAAALEQGSYSALITTAAGTVAEKEILSVTVCD